MRDAVYFFAMLGVVLLAILFIAIAMFLPDFPAGIVCGWIILGTAWMCGKVEKAFKDALKP